MPGPPNLAPINAEKALAANRAVPAIRMIVCPISVAVAAEKANPPNCAAATEEGPPQMMADSAIVHRTLRPRVLGREPGRRSGIYRAGENPRK